MTVLLLTGTCGSGKSTIADLISKRDGWTRVCEDEVWKATFQNDRGRFGTDEHRRKRQQVHRIVFDRILAAIELRHNVAVDATVHEAPPESYQEYVAFFGSNTIRWSLKVLHPRLDVAIERDRLRTEWHAGAERVRQLYAKFTFEVFPAECFVDTSDQIPEETLETVLLGINSQSASDGIG
jgi:broad-specificity NMP kinase